MPQNRKTDLTPIESADPDRLDCEYVINPYDQTGPLMCKFCRENKGATKRFQECPVRLRWKLGGTEHKLKELQDQFDILKAEALALEAKIQCTCIQTHATNCQAVTRPVDLAAPWVGMTIWVPVGTSAAKMAKITRISQDMVGWAWMENWDVKSGMSSYIPRAEYDEWVRNGVIRGGA